MSAYVFISPIFGRQGIPAITKVGISMLLSVFVLQGFNQTISIDDLSLVAFVVVVAKEAIIGLLLGYTTTVFFSVFYIAGQIIDMQMGFQMGGMFDAQLNSQVPISGNLLYAFAILTFLQLNGHLKLLYILYHCYEAIPIMGGNIVASLTNVVITGFFVAFTLAVRLVLPVILIMLIIQGVLGVMVKFIPQLNIFIIGIPIKIFIGFFVLFYMVSPMVNMFETIFDEMMLYTQSVVQQIGIAT
jgi:flagellar biosynthetic protein FliR